MKLYHGTSSRFLPHIKREGLKPRGKKRSNWEQHPSRPDAIYLTNSYAVFYASSCAKNKESLVIIEVDTDKLNPFAFGPDEDFLEQAGRGRDGVAGDMKTRSRWFRDNLHKYEDYITDYSSPANLSLKHLGNCVYFGDINPTAITKIATIKMDPIPKFVFSCFDPCIILMNYAIMGPKYRNSIKWLFGYELENDPLEKATDKHPACLRRLEITREGITIE